MRKRKCCFMLSDREKFKLELVSIERRKSMSRIIGELITKLSRKRKEGRVNVV